ncbi:MAG: protein kinase [Gemmatimonadaceae bacterium]
MTEILRQLQSSIGTAYTIERELGGGGMSRVFLATETALGRRVVIKVLTPELAQGLSAERFAREIKLAAALQEPHIVPVLSAGDANGLPYYTMPYVEGESLRARLQRGAVPTADALGILRDVALALEYAHARGIVHRDVKPENVLLSGRTAVVADFGIAKAVSAARTHTPDTPSGTLTSIGQSLGTPAYMAPEQATGDPVDHRADLYAWGVMAYELLAGRHPFAHKTNAAQLMAAQVLEKPAPLGDVAPGLAAEVAALVTRCLEKEADDRPAGATAVVHGLDAVSATAGRVSSASGPSGARGARGASASTVSTSTTNASTAPGATEMSVPPAPRANLALPIALGVVAVAVATVFFIVRKPGATTDRAPVSATVADTASRGIAVLPFENLGDSSDAYFADGMTDAVRGKLTALRGLRVIARGSSNQYRATTKPPATIAKELGVRYLLTGTVRFAGTAGAKRVLVSPELVQVGGDGQPQSVWQQPFDDEVKDVFTVQGTIAGRVAEAMQVALGGDERARLSAAPTRDPVAYELFLRGQAAWNDGNLLDAASVRRALGYFQQAVRRDSTMAEAWLMVARTSGQLVGGATLSGRDAVPILRNAVEHAVALEPNGRVGHAARSLLLDNIEFDIAGAARETELALAAAPGDMWLRRRLAGEKGALGRVEEALREQRAIAAADPRSPAPWSNLAGSLLQLRRYEEARTAIDRAIALDPLSLDQYQTRIQTELGEGDLAAAQRVYAGARQSVPAAALGAYVSMFNDLGWVIPRAEWPMILSLGQESFDNDRGSWALVRAQLYYWQGDLARAKIWGDSAAHAFRETIRQAPNNGQLYGLLGLSLAYAEQDTEAMAKAEEGVRRGDPSPILAAYIRYLEARTALLAGKRGQAMDALEVILARPYPISRAWLRIDPTWQPLKGDPRFEKLTAAS